MKSFMRKYIKDILSKADLIRLHADIQRGIKADDVKLAIEMYNENNFNKPLPLETIREFAKIRNKLPLPEIKKKTQGNIGDQLPQADYRLTNPNFQINNEEIEKNIQDNLDSEMKDESFIHAGEKRDRPVEEDENEKLEFNLKHKRSADVQKFSLTEKADNNEDGFSFE